MTNEQATPGAADSVYMSPSKAAVVLDVSRKTVHVWIRTGEIGSIRIGPRTTRVAVPRELVTGVPR